MRVILTGWPIKKFVRTARRYRTIQIRAGRPPSQPKTRFRRNCATPSHSSSS
jgi:hypothetical protein